MKVDQIHDKGVCGTSGTEVQAAKRQKLDGGILRKVECLAVIGFFFFSNRVIVIVLRVEQCIVPFNNVLGAETSGNKSHLFSVPGC